MAASAAAAAGPWRFDRTSGPAMCGPAGTVFAAMSERGKGGGERKVYERERKVYEREREKRGTDRPTEGYTDGGEPDYILSKGESENPATQKCPHSFTV